MSEVTPLIRARAYPNGFRVADGGNGLADFCVAKLVSRLLGPRCVKDKSAVNSTSATCIQKYIVLSNRII